MKKMSNDTFDNLDYLDISKLDSRPYGSAIAFVISGKCKTAVNGQPYYILYLKDYNGDSITGFKFNIADYIKDGLSLNKIKNKFVKINYCDNVTEGFSRSLIIDDLYLIENQNAINADSFIGTTPGNDTLCDEMLNIYSELFNTKITLSKLKMLTRHYDYCEGKSGGVIYHHYLVLKQLILYKDILNEKEFKELIFASMIFMVVHLEYIDREDNSFDSLAIASLLKYSSNLEHQFTIDCRTEEIIYYFSGVEPKDFYVRTVTNTFKTVKQSLSELHLNRITPLMQTGNVGYGILKRYF